LGAIVRTALWGALIASIAVLIGVIVYAGAVNGIFQVGPSLEEQAERYFQTAPPDSVEVVDCVTVHQNDSIGDSQWCDVVANVRIDRRYPGAIPIAKGHRGYCFFSVDNEAFPVERSDRPEGCIL
jgi:hypothetical protein